MIATRQLRSARSRSITASLLSVLVLASLAACSSRGGASDSAASSSRPSAGSVADLTAEVKADVDPSSKAFDYASFVPTATVSPKKGATLAIILSSLSSPQAVQFADAVKDAAAKIGWTSQAFDGQYSVNVESGLISQAVQDKVDGIVLAGIAPSTVPSPIAAAAAAKIPVINMFGYGDKDNGVTDIGTDPVAVGDEVGKWITVDSSGKAQVAVFNLPAGGAASVAINAYQDRLASVVSACGGCKVIKDTFQITDATAAGTPRYVAFLKSHPQGQVDYVAAGFDTGMIAYAKSDQQVGRTEIKTVGGFAASEAGVAEIAAKSGPVVAPAVPLGFVALATIDAIARRMNGMTVSNILIPAPLVTSANASSFPKGVFSSGTDYATAFAALWK
jgi:ribose transport system substrate-binding protein